MATGYRLRAQIGDREVRLPVGAGENIVGSSSGCALRIEHPTVSRRHARITVDADGVRLEDLGSSNGTRVAGRAVKGEVELEEGVPLRLGTVEAVLEAVPASDLEAGITVPTTAGTVDDGSRGRDADHEPAPSTVGWASLEAFALRRLPDLGERLARGEGMVEMAHAVGASLLASMPCHAVEVARGAGGSRAVLFTASHDTDPGSGAWVRADAGDEAVLAVQFVSHALADRYRPLVEACGAMLRASGREPRVARDRDQQSGAPEPPSPPSVVPEMRTIYSSAARVAPSDVGVLIVGESGTGKELLARYLHAASDRADRPLVVLNCAALPRDLLESELFGVERGVATGVDARAGKFEAAHGGTLFLDEIGDMAPETQARILRVLQEGEVFRLGSHDPRPADARLIAATNRDLDAMLADGRFRRDLYHRIADWVVELPPLRRRRADIPNLAVHFLARTCADRGVRVAGISRAALDMLVAYDWPGNVRELEKEMGRAALFLDDGELLGVGRLQPRITSAAAGPVEGDATSLKAVLERAEREAIQSTLAECGGSVPDAAARLDVGTSTLYRRMRALGIRT